MHNLRPKAKPFSNSIRGGLLTYFVEVSKYFLYDKKSYNEFKFKMIYVCTYEHNGSIGGKVQLWAL